MRIPNGPASMFSLVAICSLPLANSALAWEALECSGVIFEGIQNNITWRVDRCFTAAGSAEQSVINYGVAEWNSLVGMQNRFQIASGDNNCQLETPPAGTFEIALVPTSHPWLTAPPGFMVAGATKKRLSNTSCPSNVTAAGLVVNETLPLTSQDELSSSLGARETIIHELGHVLGAKHEDDVFSVMCAISNPTCGRAGQFSIHGSNNGRAETWLPDDTQFAFRYHAASENGPDAMVSPWTFPPARNHNATIPRCRGRTFPLTWSWGNSGNSAITPFQALTVRFVLSSDSTIAISDTNLGSVTSSSGPGGFGTFVTNLTVPSNMPTGTFFVGVIADPSNTLNETNELNNAMKSGLKVTVTTSGC